jgi:uncharacterized membrane protein YagU involved in acid resistance
MLNQCILVGKITMVTPHMVHIKIEGNTHDLPVHHRQIIPFERMNQGEMIAIKGKLVYTKTIEIHAERISMIKSKEE